MASTISAGTSAGTAIAIAGDTSGALALQTNNGTTAVTITTAQNVGVGTSSPQSTVGVNVALADTKGVVLQYNGEAKAGILLNPTGGEVRMGAINATGSYFTTLYANNAEAMRIDASTNVLINTTSNIAANAKLFTLGNGVGIAVGYGTGNAQYRHMYMNSGDGTLYFFNPTNYAYLSAAGAWTNASDARLKKNITDIKYGLADILKTQPRSYEMNSVEGEYVGFIAQELQDVIPEVVTGDPEKQLGVDYGSLVAVAFKAIQELNAKVDAQALEIQALKGVA